MSLFLCSSFTIYIIHIRNINQDQDGTPEENELEDDESPPYTLVIHGLPPDWMEKVRKVGK